MKLIPLHSVVLLLDVDRKHCFPTHECLDLDTIRNQLTGDRRVYDLNEFAFDELIKRMMAKLNLGERVVISLSAKEKEKIDRITKLATTFGVSIFYVLNPDQVEKTLARGHCMAEVISSDFGLDPVPTQFDYEMIKNKFDGITVIGDIHGMHNSLLTALSWARSRNHFIVFLGDILDYGYGSLDVVEDVYRIVMRGEGLLILGNHERKIFRWLEGRKVNLSEGNRVTVNLLNKLGETAKTKWANKFKSLYRRGHLFVKLENVVFSHAGVHPSIWDSYDITYHIENFCLFGETDTNNSEKIIRTYKWVENVPAKKISIIGHDIRAKHPYIETNAKGGQVVFLDTGSGKGGTLSSADLKFSEGGFRLENFKIN